MLRTDKSFFLQYNFREYKIDIRVTLHTV